SCVRPRRGFRSKSCAASTDLKGTEGIKTPSQGNSRGRGHQLSAALPFAVRPLKRRPSTEKYGSRKKMQKNGSGSFSKLCRPWPPARPDLHAPSDQCLDLLSEAVAAERLVLSDVA